MSVQTFQSKSGAGKQCQVLLVCRSSCADVDQRDDDQMRTQEDQLRDWVIQNITEPVEIDTLKCDLRMAADAMHDQLLQTLRAERHHLIVVSSLDRIGRGSNLDRFLELAARHHVRIISVADWFDSMTMSWRNTRALAALRTETASEWMRGCGRRSRKA